mgnify:CR=1 FL=1
MDQGEFQGSILIYSYFKGKKTGRFAVVFRDSVSLIYWERKSSFTNKLKDHLICLILHILKLSDFILQALLLEFYMCCYHPNLWHQVKHRLGNENTFLVNIVSFFIHSNYGNKLAFSLILWLKTCLLLVHFVDLTISYLHTRVSQKKTSQRSQANFMV